MPLDGYFWGMSYVYLVTLLQHTINKRIDGINIMLRKQEDPPRFMTGSTSVNQNAYAKLNKPGGYFTDGSPNAKIADLTQAVPAGHLEVIPRNQRHVRHHRRLPGDHARRGRGVSS